MLEDSFHLRGPRSFYIEGDTLELAVINPNGSDFRTDNYDKKSESEVVAKWNEDRVRQLPTY